MRINCHCHVFNFQTIFNQRTEYILEDRLKNSGCPEILAKLVMDTLRGIHNARSASGRPVKAPRLLIEQLLALRKHLDAGRRKALSAGTPADAAPWYGGGMKYLASCAPGPGDDGNWDALQENIQDYYRFVWVAFMPTISKVTDHIMSQLTPADAVVPLMMDIDPTESRLYEQQIKATAAQCLRYPGRVLPFLAVHPHRHNVLDILEKHTGDGGFVGVKLYPTLGYVVDSASALEVIRYCNDNGLPITMHCNKGGFRPSNVPWEYASPEKWRNILNGHKKLKINFAHFGGDDFYPRAGSGDVSFKEQILRLMEDFPGRVFTDISFQTTPMVMDEEGGGGSAGFFKELRRVLGKEPYRSQVLWGTDWWMVQMRVSEASYWNYYRKALGDDLFERMATRNPMKFLGLDDPDNNPNILGYITFLNKNERNLNKRRAAGWLEHRI